MKHLLILLFVFTSLFSIEVEKLSWPRGDSFLTFLNKNNIENRFYFNLEKEDQELCSEIREGATYYITRDENNKLTKALIEISEDMQLQLFAEEEGYSFDIVPINYKEIEEIISIPVKYSPYQDILNVTSNSELANEFIRAYSGSVNFKYMQKGDNIIIKYKQKIRLGQYHGSPTIISAMVEVNKKPFYIFKNDDDGRYYNDQAKSLTNYFFRVPVSYSRISSKFTTKRWHPVLKRYRAHLGVDYAAPTGRPIYSAADGRITFRGTKGGYGKVIEIAHKNGYKTLYAHQSRFKGGLKNGSKVSKGQLIGYVGSSGVSTGPHLHFGLYKNGRAINPLGVIKVTKTQLSGGAKNKFLSAIKEYIKELKEVRQIEIKNATNLKDFPPKSELKV